MQGSSSLLEPATFRAYLRSTTILVHRSSSMFPTMTSQKKWNLIQFHHGQLRHLHQKGLFNPFTNSTDNRDNKNWKNVVLSQKPPRFDSHSSGEESLCEKETEGHLPPGTRNVKNYISKNLRPTLKWKTNSQPWWSGHHIPPRLHLRTRWSHTWKREQPT